MAIVGGNLGNMQRVRILGVEMSENWLR